MGITNHNALLTTTWNRATADSFEAWLRGMYFHAYHRFEARTNGYITFCIPPDGSNEGMTESEYFNDVRSRLIERLTQDAHGDGSSPWDWIEVGFGEYGQKVLRGNCENKYDDRDYCDPNEEVPANG